MNRDTIRILIRSEMTLKRVYDALWGILSDPEADKVICTLGDGEIDVQELLDQVHDAWLDMERVNREIQGKKVA